MGFRGADILAEREVSEDRRGLRSKPCEFEVPLTDVRARFS